VAWWGACTGPGASLTAHLRRASAQASKRLAGLAVIAVAFHELSLLLQQGAVLSGHATDYPPGVFVGYAVAHWLLTLVGLGLLGVGFLLAAG
jgi:hypothetical protein